ncbi:MAG TPA: N-6 DNA methylase [Blastocatellia bacterium]|nr:N-6 DNA methylase [Blastocatellia bacterium]
MIELSDNEFLKTVPVRQRKSLGQFLTPEIIASEMVRWVTRDYRAASLLDAGAGTGVFVKRFLQGRRQSGIKSRVSIDCVDLDPRMLEFAKRGIAPAPNEKIRFIEADFLEFAPDKKYGGIISNPPYYKHHFIENKSQTVASIKNLTGYDLPVTTNIYCLFMFRARTLMSESARCALIIPGEFLNADYGVSVKKHLLDDPAFRGIISFSFDTLVFDDALTTACIVLFETGRASSNDILFASLKEPSNLPGAFRAFDGEDTGPAGGSAIEASRFARGRLDPHRKWQNYITPDWGGIEVLNPVPLARYASCSRGIATGANDFFTLSERGRREIGLPLEDLLPCITRAADVRGRVFTEADYGRLCATDSRVYLLNPGMPLREKARKYIEEGVKRGINSRYLPSHRDTWFLPERQTPAPIWVTVFSRRRARFIWNKAGVYHLTTFHGIYPNHLGQAFFAPLLVYLWSDTCQRAMQEHQRQYGNGLKKYEPRDIEKIPVPDFEKCDPKRLVEAQRALNSIERAEEIDNPFDS